MRQIKTVDDVGFVKDGVSDVFKYLGTLSSSTRPPKPITRPLPVADRKDHPIAKHVIGALALFVAFDQAGFQQQIQRKAPFQQVVAQAAPTCQRIAQPKGVACRGVHVTPLQIGARAFASARMVQQGLSKECAAASFAS